MTLDSATSPAVGTSTAVTSPGSPTTYPASVTYTATVGVPSPGTGVPTGTVSFTDGASPIAGCSDLALPDATPDQVTCTTVPGAGTNAIKATYSGHSNYAASYGTWSQVVNQATPTLTTAASSRIVLGAGSISDSATLSGGTNETGTITFKLYGPNDWGCKGTPAKTLTASVAGDGTYASGDYTPAAAGTFRWVASYGGDANNSGVSDVCNGAGENVKVLATKATPSLTTNASGNVRLGGSVRDRARLWGGSQPTGTITFKLYGPGNCTTLATTSTATVSGNGAYTSAAYAPAAVGTYQWVASYGGDSFDNAASGACGDPGESVTVEKATPSISTQASGDVTLGGAVSDSATLAGGSSPSGTITFSLYGPNVTDCNGAPVKTLTASVSGDGTYGSGDYTPTTAGNYRWVASYGGDGSNNPVASFCGGEQVKVAKVAPTLTTTASGTVAAGGLVHDTATLSGGDSPTGTITFRLYGPNRAGCGAAIATATAAVNGNGTYSSGSFTLTVPGTYEWVASYGGDTDNAAVTDPCGASGESVTVTRS